MTAVHRKLDINRTNRTCYTRKEGAKGAKAMIFKGLTKGSIGSKKEVYKMQKIAMPCIFYGRALNEAVTYKDVL